jgi:type IV fimbrial biogenesis protein FimT
MRRRVRGFTIAEMMVGVGIIALLLGLAAPSMGTYLQNSKLANVTQDFYAGLQLARAEAIHRNLPVQFVLTDTPVNTANLENTVVPAVAGHSWVVRAASDTTATAFFLVEAKAAQEGALNAAPAGAQASATGPVGFAGIVSFNGFGGTSDGGTYQLDITNPTAGACASGGGPIRCRRINVTPGGRVSACDPAVVAPDSRACQP